MIARQDPQAGWGLARSLAPLWPGKTGSVSRRGAKIAKGSRDGSGDAPINSPAPSAPICVICGQLVPAFLRGFEPQISQRGRWPQPKGLNNQLNHPLRWRHGDTEKRDTEIWRIRFAVKPAKRIRQMVLFWRIRERKTMSSVNSKKENIVVSEAGRRPASDTTISSSALPAARRSLGEGGSVSPAQRVVQSGNEAD